MEWEVVIMILLILLNGFRLSLATRGNKTEELSPLVWSMGLIVPALVGHVFFLCLQTYVLQIDVVLNSLSLTFLSTEFILSGYIGYTFYISLIMKH